MGRKPYKHRNLPPRMRVRERGRRVYYYYDLGGRPRREKALGSDYILAMQQWAELEQADPPVRPTFNDAADRYVVDVLPYKAARTQRDNQSELESLREFFGDGPLDEIEPVHIVRFMDWRRDLARKWLADHGKPLAKESGNVRANREKSLFSHVFNHARRKGLTSATNPCSGIGNLAESGRDVYIEDGQYKAVWNAATQPLRDAMDLAYLTGQRPGDTVKMTEHDIKDGYLHVRQGKTGAKIRIAVEGELLAVLERIRKRRAGYKIVTTYLVVNDTGRPVQGRTVTAWFDAARKEAGLSGIQFRDLRAKAGTDKDDTAGMGAARDQLGHTTERTTRLYVRHRLGKKVSPTR